MNEIEGQLRPVFRGLGPEVRDGQVERPGRLDRGAGAPVLLGEGGAQDFVAPHQLGEAVAEGGHVQRPVQPEDLVDVVHRGAVGQPLDQPHAFLGERRHLRTLRAGWDRSSRLALGGPAPGRADALIEQGPGGGRRGTGRGDGSGRGTGRLAGLGSTVLCLHG